MAKCAQCTNPAFYQIGNDRGSTALCLPCLSIYEGIQFREWLKHAAMLNHASAEMDSIMGGIGGLSPKIPVEALARAVSMAKTYNNISISNSNVGVLNTGNLARIDAAITIAQGTDTAEFAARLKDLTETIDKVTEANEQQKNQLIEIITAISDQTISRQPSKVVVGTLFEKLVSLTSGLTTIAGAVEKLHEAWRTLPFA